MGGCASVRVLSQGAFIGILRDSGIDPRLQETDAALVVPLNCDNVVQALSIDPNGPDLVLLHFNDCHNLIPPKSTEPIGGATRFATLVKKYRAERDCLLLFSGDVFNPSRLSTVTKGKHCGPVLHALRPDCGVYGNHDFDFGVEDLVKLAGMCGMPWVMTNVVDTSGKAPVPVANSQKHYMLTHRGIKVGIIGIVEQEWLDTIRDLPSFVQYVDKVSSAKVEITLLKEAGAQLIIALTHMREYNDRAFLEDVPEVDLLLGGHDHYYLVADVNGAKLVKSSADFVHTTLVEIWLPTPERARVRVETTQIPIVSSIPEDPQIKGLLEGYDKELAGKLGKEVCRVTRELDVMCETVRTQEAPAGNWIADIMREEMACDCAIVNSGVMRANLVYLPGVLKLKDILDILPMEDIVVSMLVPGFCLKEALECGVSKFPALEGRFPQVSGLKLLLDPTAKPMERIKDIMVGGKLLMPQKLYKLATTSYLSTGGDGYVPLKEGKYVVEIENGRILPTMVRQYLDDLVGKEQKMDRRMSVQCVKDDRRLGRFEQSQSISEIRKAYLPIVSPQVEGRIIISDLYANLRAMNANNVSSPSIHSFRSELSYVPRTPASRRTSVAHPIHIRRTMTNLVDIEYSHEAQEAEPMQWEARSSDGGSVCRPSSTVPYIQRFATATELTDVPSHAVPAAPGPPPPAPVLAGVPLIVPPGNLFRSPSEASGRSIESLRLPGPELGRSMSSSTCVSMEADRRFPATSGNIYDAAAKGDVEALQAIMRTTKVLLNRKGSPNFMGLEQLKANGLGAMPKDVGTPLHFAIAFGHLKAVEYLLDQGSDTRECTQMGGNARELAFAHLVKAHAKGNAVQVKAMESIISALKYHEENMTEEQRFMMYR
eukprot:EG_transcript_1460